jgi:hypothetical protein
MVSTFGYFETAAILEEMKKEEENKNLEIS